MKNYHNSLTIALSLTLCLAFAPHQAVADGAAVVIGRISCDDGESRREAAKTAAAQYHSDAVKDSAEAVRPVDKTLCETPSPTGAKPAEDRAVQAVRQTDVPSSKVVGTLRALPSSHLSPQEEELLLSMAAAGSKLASGMRPSAGVVLLPSKQGVDSQTEPEGTLSHEYESGGNIAAIGYDTKGGTSYGLYQIASNSGTMEQFLQYLADKAPDLYSRLAGAGPDNTGGRSGGKPEAWKQIAAEQDKRFAALQHNFIRKSHYEPAARSISKTCGLVVSEKPQAMREVLWSTSVHLGVQRATKIFVTAVDNLIAKGVSAQNYDRSMIEEIYRLRSNLLDGNGESATAVRNRLQNEKKSAVAML